MSEQIELLANELDAPLVPSRYWLAAAEGRLEIPFCEECSRFVWYPRPRCPFCMGESLSWVVAGGRGSVYSFTVNYRGQGAYRNVPPVVIAYVDLEEGPRIVSHLVDVEVSDIVVGMAVEAVFLTPMGSGHVPLVRFAPASAD